MLRIILIAACLACLGGAAWFGAQPGAMDVWKEVAPGVYRSPGAVAGYALIDGDAAVLIDAPLPLDEVRLPGNPKIEAVYLTHPHRPVCAGVASFLDAKVPVHAPKAAAEWLTRDGVAKFWKEALPLRSSRTAYFVVPAGFTGIDLSLTPGQKIVRKSWSLQLLDAPGHARAQLAVLAQKHGGKKVLFAGGAIASPGKLFAPYTTDWDHWTDLGLVPTAKSLDALAEVGPDVIAPSYGPVISANAPAALRQTAAAVREAGFLKSFERFTKNRLGNEPQYAFLAKEQAESNGSKPWSQVSKSLYLTGNTYVLVSKDGACLMVDPWGMRSADQWQVLKRDKSLGPLEVVWFSHAHYDHYDGVYDLPRPDTFEAWTLDLVAPPLEQPLHWRAPFLDPRPVTIHKKPKSGETLTWREYRFRFHHFPGQSYYTMGVETEIDGKKCFFTADNFYHQDMFAGTGGWMGLNRAFPPYYAASAKTVLDAAPDWVLAEHGGPFEFSAEDWRRRIAWAEASGKALDALSPSGRHMWDYNPHVVRIEPLVVKAKAGAEVHVELVVENERQRPIRVDVALQGKSFAVDAAAGQTRRTPVTLRAPGDVGRHVVALYATEAGELCPADAFGVIDVE
jgi:glyoxylase-like metal-dependent hydrolase (beta-lactamase superfamily II)